MIYYSFYIDNIMENRESASKPREYRGYYYTYTEGKNIEESRRKSAKYLKKNEPMLKEAL